MKHIFAVTSNFTFALTQKICSENSIDADSCVLLLLRNYHIPDQYSSTYTHQIHTSYNVDQKTGRIFANINIIQTQKNIRYFDQKIYEQVKNDDFLFYTSVCSNDICSLMVSKPNCKGYYIIEDGLASYRNYNPQTFTGIKFPIYKFILKPLFPRLFCVKNHFITTEHNKFKGCIATRQDCFPLHQKYLQVIGNPFPKNTSTELPDAVISIDPWYQYIDFSKTKEIYSQLSDYIIPHKFKRLACKFHPRFDAPQNSTIKEQYINILSDIFPNINFLPADTVLEQILCMPTQSFYCGISSVALYASLCGVKCYSFMPLAKGTPAYEVIPPVLRNIVTEIYPKE